MARAISDPGALYEVLTSPDGKTWTAILTPPGGLTCVIGTGEYWEQIALASRRAVISAGSRAACARERL